MDGQSAVQLKKLRKQLDGFRHWILRGIRWKFRVGRKLMILEFDAEPFGSGPLPALFSILPGKVDECCTHTSGKRVGQYKLEHHTYCYRTDAGVP